MDTGLSYMRELMCEKGGHRGSALGDPRRPKLLGVGCVGWERESGSSSPPPILWKNTLGLKARNYG